jgi:hypothetical protein
MGKDKSLWIGLIVFVVVVGVILWKQSIVAPAPAPVPLSGKDTTLLPVPVASAVPRPIPAATIESTEDTGTASVDIGAPAGALSYAEALITYKDARLALDANCRSSPSNLQLKNNSLLMIDNRSPVPRKVKVGITFPVKAFGFKIIKLSSATLPVTWMVDCDKSQDVASILIEIK